jgi:hypothetical protein
MKIFMHHYREEIEGYIVFSVPIRNNRRFGLVLFDGFYKFFLGTFELM